jgi:hypothetical protein
VKILELQNKLLPQKSAKREYWGLTTDFIFVIMELIRKIYQTNINNPVGV